MNEETKEILEAIEKDYNGRITANEFFELLEEKGFMLERN